MLWKRGDELNDQWLKFFGHPESYFFGKPEESSAAHASSSSSLPVPADGSMDVDQPLPYTPKEPSSVPSPDHTPPSQADEMGEQQSKFFDLPLNHFFLKPEESSAERPPLGPADWWTDIEQSHPSIPKEPSPVSILVGAPPTRGNKLSNLWPKLSVHRDGQFYPKPEASPAARPSSSSAPPAPAHGSMDVGQPPPSISEGQASGPTDEWMDVE
jgi:hypothetical protein